MSSLAVSRQLSVILTGTSPDGLPMCLRHSGACEMRIYLNRNAECFRDSHAGVLGDLSYRQQKLWREVDALSPREMYRKAVT
eukprot:1143220-Pelagomonas_calceolata.AAC.1